MPSHPPRFLLNFFAAFALAAICAPSASAALKAKIVSPRLNEPISITSPPGEEDRLFTTDRETGTIDVIESPTNTSVFLDLDPENNVNGFPGVETSEFEYGILSMAFAPDYPESHLFYVIYTVASPSGNADLQLDEFETDEAGDAIPSSRRPVMTIDHSIGKQHYGGQLQFGPDGYLYISTGDGSSGSGNLATYKESQDLDKLLGKILRIDPQDPDGNGLNSYSAPTDNPFSGAGVPGADEVWSYGLRNPWRFSFDSVSGDMLIGDVGEERAEEINRGVAVSGLGAGRGLNFGWPCREGFFATSFTNAFGCTTLASGWTDPAFAYPHSPLPEDPAPKPASGCAVIGGYVVHDPSLGDVDGRYLYADLCTDQIRSFELSNPAGTDRLETFVPNPPQPGYEGDSPETFGVDSCGRIYVASGFLYRLEGATPTDCTPEPDPKDPTDQGQPPQPRPVPSPVAPDVKLQASRKKVAKHRRAKLTVTVSPCPGRAGDTVSLQEGKSSSSKPLDPHCRAVFRPRINRRTVFRATIAAGNGYLAGESNSVAVRVKSNRRARGNNRSSRSR